VCKGKKMREHFQAELSSADFAELYHVDYYYTVQIKITVLLFGKIFCLKGAVMMLRKETLGRNAALLTADPNAALHSDLRKAPDPKNFEQSIFFKL
jgi:hypothetical protein